MTSKINELEAIRKAVTEIALKHDSLVTDHQNLKASLLALQIYVATGLYPLASAEALQNIQDLAKKAQNLVSRKSSPTTDDMAKLLKALRGQKPGQA